jgi:DNA excision repair protein ERCC-2
VDGLAQQNVARGIADQLRADPALPDDTVQEVIPGNIRRGEHFLTLLKRFVEFIKVTRYGYIVVTVKTRMRVSAVVSETPLTFLQKLLKVTQIDAKTLR